MGAVRTVVVDAFPESAFRHLERDAIACVDVMTSCTTLVTGLAQGRRVLVAVTEEEARRRASSLADPLLAGERNGAIPEGFDLRDCPSELARRTDLHRPLLLASSPGTALIVNASPCRTVYVVCLRNLAATAAEIARHGGRVAVLGAGRPGEFSCEDQMAAAWLAGRLMELGFEAEDRQTSDLVRRWRGTDVALAGWGNSAHALRRLGREDDVEFILSHTDDIPFACVYERGELRRREAAERQEVGAGLTFDPPSGLPLQGRRA